MMKRIAAILLVLALCLTSVMTFTTASAAGQATRTATVTGGWLRLRAAPDYSAETLASYFTGTRVTVLGATGSWYYVVSPDHITGYMHASYLKFDADTDKHAAITSENGQAVRIRAGAGVNYNVLGLYPVGTQVTILSSGIYWTHIRVDSTKAEGYIMTKYLTTDTPDTDEHIAYVYSTNGYGVRLREGPGVSYRTLATLDVGTAVVVLVHQDTWDQISVNGMTGYIMNKYLTTDTDTYMLKSVKLNAQSAFTGTTLSPVLSPAYATVTCQWLNDFGVILSTAPTYTVQAADVGRSIRVKVTGTGAYKGTAISDYVKIVSYNPGPTNPPSTQKLTAVYLNYAAPAVGDLLQATVSPYGATVSFAWFRDGSSYIGSGSSYRVTAADQGHAITVQATGYGNFSGTVTSTAVRVAAAPQAQTLSGTVSLPNYLFSEEPISPQLSLNTSKVTYEWYADGVLISTAKTLPFSSSLLDKTVTLKVTAIAGSGYTGSVYSNTCKVLGSTLN